MKDLTLITCSYNTPKVTHTMLRSFFIKHRDLIDEMNLIVVENSTNNKTRKIFKDNNIKYIKNKGGTHSPSVDIALNKCKTKYALLLDTDIIFNASIEKLFKMFKQQKAQLMGEVCGSRGGYNLHTRVHPWFCFIDVGFIKKNKIKFHDEKRIIESGSQYFYKSDPLHPYPNNEKPYYDVGSTFFEDIESAKGKILNFVPKQGNPYLHIEGVSWSLKSANVNFNKLGESKEAWFNEQVYDKFKSINIKNFYRYK